MAKAGRKRKPCGTFAAYRRHQGLGQPVDAECQAAADYYYSTRTREKRRAEAAAPAVKAKVPSGWRERALCADSGLDWWPNEDDARAVSLCVEVCERCPVKNECLSDALSYHVAVDLGVRGGLTMRERRSLRRMLRASA